LGREFDEKHLKEKTITGTGEFVNQDKGEDTDEWALQMISYRLYQCNLT
jgi:hypothetical protein